MTYPVDLLAGKCSLVGRAADMFSTWTGGAEVQHVKGCDGRCELQLRLDAMAKMRRRTMSEILGDDDEDY
jgi:hypothetical protein